MKYGKIGALAGTVYVVGVLLGNGLAEAGKDTSETKDAILANLQKGPSPANLVGFCVELAAFIALTVFVAYAYRLLARVEGPEGWLSGFTLLAGALALIVKVGSAAPVIAGIYRKDDLSAEAARTLNDLNGGAFIIDGFATGLFVLGFALCARDCGLLGGRTTAIGAALGALAALAGGLGIVAPAAYVPLAFLGCLVWIAVVGVVLARRSSDVRESVSAIA